MEDEIKQRLKRSDTWLRGLYMLIFSIIYGIAKFLILLVALFQFLSVLFTSNTNEQLVKFGQNISTYIYQMSLFLTYNSEWRPFPFGEWPDGSPDKNIEETEQSEDINETPKQ